MPTLTIVRGLPGSGKTTWAKAQVGSWRVCRDDLRGMRNDVWDFQREPHEALVTLMQRELITLLLERGENVVVDDTNLNWRHVQDLVGLVRGVKGASVAVKEFLHVPVAVCIERDALRPNPVGETVIMEMYRRYMEDADE